MPAQANGRAYATRSDLYKVISAQSLTHPSTGPEAQDTALLDASELADGYLRQQFKLPLASWGRDLTQKVCHLAAYNLICLRGVNPEEDGSYKDNYDSAVRWLERVAQGLVSPDVVDASPASAPGKQATSRAPVAYSPVAVTSSGNQTRGTGQR